jgi:hypothetical protein
MAVRTISDELLKETLAQMSVAKAAIKLGITERNIYTRKAKMARQGWSPDHGMTKTVPDGFHLKGTSTLYDETGAIKAQWVKTNIDHERQEELFRAVIEAMSEEIPRLSPIKAPLKTRSDLCNLYTLTDTHVGALCWQKEGGADWNLEIAENTLVESFRQMMAGSPDSSTAVLCQLGDMLHYDSLDYVTPTSKNLVDAAGNYSQMVAVAIRIIRKIVDMALSKHDNLHVIMAEGNHDLASSVWLRQMFAALYENEPRITVNNSELPYYVYQHGSTMLAFHHGHKKNNGSLPLFFASQYPRIWGDTTKRFIHTGHRHHLEVKEHSGAKVVQHPTLAARDAHASRGGWLSDRQAYCITYHVQYGEVGTNTVCPEMIEALA